MQSDFALAVAHAEGFGVPGAVPTLAHNPGDLKVPGWNGPTLGAEQIPVFADDATGWAALEHQLTLIRTRQSHVYTPSMTILDMARKWTDTAAPEWAENVCDWLRRHGRTASPDMPLSAVLG